MTRADRARLSGLILSNPHLRNYLADRLKVYGTCAMHNHPLPMVAENVKIHTRIDLRPVLHADTFKLCQHTPREATSEEKERFEIDYPEPGAYVYKYLDAKRTVVIYQFFTLDHRYLGGGEHEPTESDKFYMSDEDMARIAAVSQF